MMGTVYLAVRDVADDIDLERALDGLSAFGTVEVLGDRPLPDDIADWESGEQPGVPKPAVPSAGGLALRHAVTLDQIARSTDQMAASLSAFADMLTTLHRTGAFRR